MNNQVIATANNPDVPLQSLLEQALLSPMQRVKMLQQPEILGKILNDISARRWLFEMSRQTEDLNQAFKARLLIISIMQQSRTIWRGGNSSPEVYDEALARTWKWFSENLHEYDPARANFVTWFNHRLRFAIIDIIQTPQPLPLPDNIIIPDPKSRWVEAKILYEQIVDLVKRDPGNYLRNSCMQNNLHVTCQSVILAILQSQPTSPDIPWEALANRFDVSQRSLRNFCNDTAFPRFKRFCHHHGIYDL